MASGLPGWVGWSAHASAYASNSWRAKSIARRASSSTSRSERHGPGARLGAAARRTVAAVRRYVITALPSCGTAASSRERSSRRRDGGSGGVPPFPGWGGCEGVETFAALSVEGASGVEVAAAGKVAPGLEPATRVEVASGIEVASDDEVASPVELASGDEPSSGAAAADADDCAAVPASAPTPLSAVGGRSAVPSAPVAGAASDAADSRSGPFRAASAAASCPRASGRSRRKRVRSNCSFPSNNRPREVATRSSAPLRSCSMTRGKSANSRRCDSSRS